MSKGFAALLSLLVVAGVFLALLLGEEQVSDIQFELSGNIAELTESQTGELEAFMLESQQGPVRVSLPGRARCLGARGEIKKAWLATGDYVEVKLTGPLAESYPMQGEAAIVYRP